MIKLWLKRVFYRLKYSARQVKIGSKVELDTKSSFEGLNNLAANCSVTQSQVGLGTYISSGSVIRKARIGRFCSIGSNVQTGLGTHPVRHFVSTHPAFFSTQQQAGFTFTSKDIFEEHIFIDAERRYVVNIGSDVWIGSNVTIVDGIHIGNGAIVAAGAVVTKNVAPYTIVAGVPARFVRDRFNPQQVEQLEKIQWWNWSISKIKEKSPFFADIEIFLAGA